jgi:hypothetical protein
MVAFALSWLIVLVGILVKVVGLIALIVVKVCPLIWLLVRSSSVWSSAVSVSPFTAIGRGERWVRLYRAMLRGIRSSCLLKTVSVLVVIGLAGAGFGAIRDPLFLLIMIPSSQPTCGLHSIAFKIMKIFWNAMTVLRDRGTGSVWSTLCQYNNDRHSAIASL